MRMPRMQLYLPDDLYELVKERGLPASELLQKAVVLPALHMASPGFLKLNPQWDPVRNDPRFAQALASGEAAIKSRPAGY